MPPKFVFRFAKRAVSSVQKGSISSNKRTSKELHVLKVRLADSSRLWRDSAITLYSLGGKNEFTISNFGGEKYAGTHCITQ